MEKAKRIQVVRVRKREAYYVFLPFLYSKHDFWKSIGFSHASTVASTVHLLCIYCASTVHLLYKNGISRTVQIWSPNGTQHGTTAWQYTNTLCSFERPWHTAGQNLLNTNAMLEDRKLHKMMVAAGHPHPHNS